MHQQLSHSPLFLKSFSKSGHVFGDSSLVAKPGAGVIPIPNVGTCLRLTLGSELMSKMEESVRDFEAQEQVASQHREMLASSHRFEGANHGEG